MYTINVEFTQIIWYTQGTEPRPSLNSAAYTVNLHLTILTT